MADDHDLLPPLPVLRDRLTRNARIFGNRAPGRTVEPCNGRHTGGPEGASGTGPAVSGRGGSDEAREYVRHYLHPGL